MESKVSRNPDSGKSKEVVGIGAAYKEAVRKKFNDEVKQITDQERQKAIQELMEERYMMASKVSFQHGGEKFSIVGISAEYKEAVRKQLNNEVKNVIDLEILKATQELMEEQKKATKQLVEEFRATIREIVQEEKEEIWKKTETLKESTLQIGL